MQNLVKEAMAARHWQIPDLARAMEGDELRNRFVLGLFLGEDGGDLGPHLCDVVATALGLSGTMLSDLEAEWSQYWKELSVAATQLQVESSRSKRIKRV